MPTRDEEAEQWRLISLNSRKAAQHLLEPNVTAAVSAVLTTPPIQP